MAWAIWGNLGKLREKNAGEKVEELGLGGGGCEIIPSSPHPRLTRVGHVKASESMFAYCCWLLDLRPIPATPDLCEKGPRRSSRLFAGDWHRPNYTSSRIAAMCFKGPPMQEPSIPPCKVTRAHLGRWVISSRPRPLTSVLIFPLLTVTPAPEKTLALLPEYQIAQDLSFCFFPALLPPSYPSIISASWDDPIV